MLFPLVVPSAESAGLVTCSGPDCNLCSFVTMVNNLVAWLVGFLTLAAVLAIVYAGFKLVVSGGDEGAMTDAKKMLTNIVIGFVIVLSAWLIVDTLMKALVAPGVGFGVWNDIPDSQCGGIITPVAEDDKTKDEPMYCFEATKSGAPTKYASEKQSKCDALRQSYLDKGYTANACYPSPCH